MKQYQVRQFETELRFSKNSNIVEGYAATFNSFADGLPFKERIQPGAFAKTISDGANVACLFNHDPNYVLGSTAAGTLKLSEDARGLKFSSELPNTTYGNDIKELLARGDISKCSFGFMPVKENFINEGGEEVRELVEVKLLDVSLVCFPAYGSTTCFLQRSILEKDFNINLDELIPALQRLRAGAFENDDKDIVKSVYKKLDAIVFGKGETPRMAKFL